MNSGQKSGQLDPEIAALMGIAPESKEVPPAFTALFVDEKAANKASSEEADLSKKSFEAIKKFEEARKPFFSDKDYYKKLLSGEGEISKKVHQLLSQFITAKDPKDKSIYRSRLMPAFWDLGAGIAARIGQKLPIPKLLLLRFGILSPTLISKEQRDVISRIVFKKDIKEPVHYQDEWLLQIARGSINPSATDEVKQVKKNEDQKTRDRIEKMRGQRQAELSLLQNKIVQLEEFEANLLNQAQCILKHQSRADFGGLKDAYTPEQKEAITQVSTSLRNLTNLDRDIKSAYSNLEEMDSKLAELAEKTDRGEAASSVDRSTVINEFNSIRQMSKLCVGRQGNHFPILLKQYIHANIREIATRENVIDVMARVEELDPLLFYRTFKGQTNRIVPHVLLLPNYGETGICWEPFERFNRASSRGRIAIPLYPKEVKEAVTAALADLRWQIAKEKAQHYWMEEGITGRYYQWFSERKLKGDVRDSFIRDYILWITKESQATQKLDREVRGIFWRQMPFPQKIKDNLKNRGFVYNELYKKDDNISRSDGY